MKRNVITSIMAAAMLALAIPAGAARTQDALLKVNDIKVSRTGSDLILALDIDPRAINPGRDREVTFTPVVRSAAGNDSVVLPSVKIAGRNRYYWHLRNNDLPVTDAYYYAGDRKPIAYRAETPFQPWMENATIDMLQNNANCCDKPKVGPETPLAKLDYTVPAFEPAFKFVQLTGDSAIVLSAEGRAFVDFVVNRTEIRPDYRRNRVELGKIISSIDKVKNDPDATITQITIKGFASPEGSYENNVRLAMGRTQSLKDYVKNHYKFQESIMHTDYEPEDWDGLRVWVENSNISNKQGILDIINSGMAPDPRNTAIQTRYPREYKLLLDSVYPGLRHSDYTVKYRIKAYATVEELLAAYAATPERLRPVDFQRIAAKFPVGSDKYKEIMRKAVEIHPNDPKSNLNAANIAMEEGNLKAAGAYLDRAGNSAEAAFSRGVFAGMEGDLKLAKHYFEESAKLGFKDAEAQSAKIDAMVNKPGVEYLIKTDK